MFLTLVYDSCSALPVGGDAGQGGTTRAFILIKTGFQNGLGGVISVCFFLAIGEGIYCLVAFMSFINSWGLKT